MKNNPTVEEASKFPASEASSTKLNICKFCKKEFTRNKKANNQSVCSKACIKESTKRLGISLKKIKGIRIKLLLTELMGGGCEKCGYNKNLTALEFHHRDKTKKESQLSLGKLTDLSEQVILEEAVKCQLLCANCHREEHNPAYRLENLRDLI